MLLPWFSFIMPWFCFNWIITGVPIQFALQFNSIDYFNCLFLLLSKNNAHNLSVSQSDIYFNCIEIGTYYLYVIYSDLTVGWQKRFRRFKLSSFQYQWQQIQTVCYITVSKWNACLYLYTDCNCFFTVPALCTSLQWQAIQIRWPAPASELPVLPVSWSCPLLSLRCQSWWQPWWTLSRRRRHLWQLHA